VDRLVAPGKHAGKEPASVQKHPHPNDGHAHGNGLGNLLSLDARVLARECLKEVGHELGVPR